MPKLKIKKKINWKKFKKNDKKKHVETMFLTNKTKNYPFYFKFPNIRDIQENNYNKYNPRRNFFYIKCLHSGYLTIHPLKAIIRLFKWFIKNFKLEDILKYKLYVFPDFVSTSKPKEVRMGKGKGANLSKVAIIKKNQFILSLYNNSSKTKINVELINLLLKKMIHKLPFRAIILRNN